MPVTVAHRSSPLVLAAVAFFLSVASTGCADEEAMFSGSVNRAQGAAMHSVTVDPNPWETATPIERRAAEQKAINEIVARTPAGLRQEARRLLEDRTSPGSFTASTDPEIARLLGVIVSIRVADDAPARARAAEDRDADALRAAQRLRVTVALVPELGVPNARVTILRRPDDNGRPIVLVREADFTPLDLAFGVSLAARSVSELGDTPLSESRKHYVETMTAEDPGSETLAWASSFAGLLRRALKREVPGVGTVQTLDTFTRRHGL